MFLLQSIAIIMSKRVMEANKRSIENDISLRPCLDAVIQSYLRVRRKLERHDRTETVPHVEFCTNPTSKNSEEKHPLIPGLYLIFKMSYSNSYD